MQQWLNERSLMLRYTYSARLVTNAALALGICLHFLPVFIIFVVYIFNLKCILKQLQFLSIKIYSGPQRIFVTLIALLCAAQCTPQNNNLLNSKF